MNKSIGLLPSVTNPESLSPRGEVPSECEAERVSEVGRDYSQNCNGEGNLELLHTFAITILHIVTTYLRHPFHRYRGPPSP